MSTTNLKKYTKIIVSLNIWKFIYWMGIALGGIIFVVASYNIIMVVTGNYDLMYKGKFSMYAAKCGIRCTINAILVFALPCAVSLLFKFSYFYRIILVLLYILFSLILLIFF